MRKKYIKEAKRVVVKVGTRVLTDSNGKLDEAQIKRLVEQFSWLKRKGIELVVVTSGAIGAGMGELQLAERPKSLSELQAVAAVGQIRLMHLYHDLFYHNGFQTGQILLSAEDMQDKQHHTNAQNTFSTLLAHKVIPLVNENDSVAVDEIRFGDNDFLSSLVVELVDADLLVILSMTDGLLTQDPSEGKKGDRLSEVKEINEAIEKMVGESKSDLGTGGMKSKLEAAKRVMSSGKGAVFVNGWTKDVLVELFKGEDVGTFFCAKKN